MDLNHMLLSYCYNYWYSYWLHSWYVSRFRRWEKSAWES